MCGYDPFWLYDERLDIEGEMFQLGIDDYDEYLDWKYGKDNENE